MNHRGMKPLAKALPIPRIAEEVLVLWSPLSQESQAENTCVTLQNASSPARTSAQLQKCESQVLVEKHRASARRECDHKSIIIAMRSRSSRQPEGREQKGPARSILKDTVGPDSFNCEP